MSEALNSNHFAVSSMELGTSGGLTLQDGVSQSSRWIIIRVPNLDKADLRQNIELDVKRRYSQS